MLTYRIFYTWFFSPLLLPPNIIIIITFHFNILNNFSCYKRTVAQRVYLSLFSLSLSFCWIENFFWLSTLISFFFFIFSIWFLVCGFFSFVVQTVANFIRFHGIYNRRTYKKKRTKNETTPTDKMTQPYLSMFMIHCHRLNEWKWNQILIKCNLTRWTMFKFKTDSDIHTRHTHKMKHFFLSLSLVFLTVHFLSMFTVCAGPATSYFGL